MKEYSHYHLLKPFLAALLLLASCGGSSDGRATPQASPTQTAVSRLPTITSNPTPIVPPTEPATATLQPTPTPEPTATPFLSPSPVSNLPTLTAAERELRLRDWLREYPDCALPCWWGILPGISPWSDAEAQIQSLGGRTSPRVASNGTIDHGVGGYDFSESSVYNSIVYSERSEQVDRIHIKAEGHSNTLAFQQAWARYAPRILLLEYGPPSRVWMTSAQSIPTSPENPKVGYGLWLFYDDLGFVVGYSGVIDYTPTYHVCPRFEDGMDIASLEMLLHYPNSPLPLEGGIEAFSFIRNISCQSKLQRA